MSKLKASIGNGPFVGVLWTAGLVLTLAGCGGRTEPKVSESGQFLIAAREAIGRGDSAKAMEALNASIESEPNPWAYLERAQINAKQGADQAVLDDCREILKLAPENRDVAWLQGELKKPVDKRFKGSSEFAPSFSK